MCVKEDLDLVWKRLLLTTQNRSRHELISIPDSRLYWLCKTLGEMTEEKRKNK